MNTEDIKNKIGQFAKSQLPFLVKLYERIQEKLPSKKQENESNLSEETSEFDLDDVASDQDMASSDETIEQAPDHHLEIDEELDLADEHEKNQDNEELKKEKRSKIIRIIAILGILYFAIDEFVLSKKGDENLNEDEISQVQNNNRARKSVDKDIDDIDRLTDDKTQEIEEGIRQKQEEKRRQEELSDLDNNDFSAQDLANANNLEEDELQDLNESPDLESEKNQDFTQKDNDGLETVEFDNTGYEPIKDEASADNSGEILFKEDEFEDITVDELQAEIEQTQTSEQIENSPQDEEIDGVSINVLKELEQKLKEKELTREQELSSQKEDLSLQGQKVPIVDYFREGRGLVYNCQSRHWACIDEISYLQCREGFQINNLKNAASTCLPFNVYHTLKDCKRAQYNAMGSEEEMKCRR